MNCPEMNVQCTAGMIRCSASKPICIPKAAVCDGLNDCGMYEDEQNCCGRVGFIRCADGTCVTGERCDAKADCFDTSDEYNCPDPNSEFYTKCTDGQLIESTYKCEGKSYPSFQCNDLSDETHCQFKPQPLESNPALKSLQYDKASKCFKQAFTFQSLSSEVLELNYPDNNMRKFAANFEFSPLRFAAVIGVGINIFLPLLSVLFLSCIGCSIKNCRSIRRMFVGLSIIYVFCLIVTLFIGIYWVSYMNALNEVVENPAESDIYERVAIETIRVTGGFASIRISTHLTFYNCGFFALAFILSVIAAQLVKKASCHQQITYMEKCRPPVSYRDDPLAAHHLLTGTLSVTNSDTGTATPEQTVYPQHRAFRSIDKTFIHSASDSQLRHPHLPPTNSTYISYDKVDSLARTPSLSPALHHIQTRTLDRQPIKHTQV